MIRKVSPVKQTFHRSSNRDGFYNICYYFPKESIYVLRTDMSFPGGFIEISRRVYRTDMSFQGQFIEQTCLFKDGLSNRHVFSRRVYRTDMSFQRRFIEQTCLFQEGLSNRHVFSGGFIEQTCFFQEGLSNRHVFLRRFCIRILPGASRKSDLVLEHIHLLRKQPPRPIEQIIR